MINLKGLTVALSVLGLNLAYATLTDKTDATQIQLKNNQTVIVPLSNSDPNRLFVRQDKITHANCLQGFCGVNYDESGSIYLTLGDAAKFSSGFSIFMVTENGKHFTVIGMPEKAVGKTVEFSITGGTHKAQEAFQKKSPYQAILIQIITAMINYRDGDEAGLQDIHLSAVDIPNDPQIKTDRQGLLIQPIQLFTGGLFQGIVYAIKNSHSQRMTLTTQQFYQKSMVAGALSKMTLKQGEIGYFYGVIQVEEGGSDV